MSPSNRELGNKGEDIATRYLEKKGYRIVTRNFRNNSGEIDIIARDKRTYVFVEVKARHSSRFGAPNESVTMKKQRQIIRVAAGYLARYQLDDVPVRFDVIAILMESGNPDINHFVSAFDAT